MLGDLAKHGGEESATVEATAGEARSVYDSARRTEAPVRSRKGRSCLVLLWLGMHVEGAPIRLEH